MRFSGGSVHEEKRHNGKSFNPKHWRICLSFTIEEEQPDGSVKKRRKKVQRIVQGTKTHAYEVRDQLISELDNQGNTLDEVVQQQKRQEKVEATTLTDMIETWHAARKTAGSASERTLTEDRRRLKHIERHLGNFPIKDINAQMVEATYAAVREERGLSGTSMNQIHTLLKNVFQKAIDYDIIYKNPCAHVVTPRRDDPNRKSLSAEQSAKLLRTIEQCEEQEYAAMAEKEERRAYREAHGIAKQRNAIRGLHQIGCIMAVRIGLATGMRRGEVFGLTWGNVDLERQTIRVCQAVTYKGVIKTPKTQAGNRTVAIDDATVACLARWKARQKAELAKICVEQTGDTMVCCSDTGELYRIDNFEHWWSVWRKKNGFEGLKFHELRHTQATVLLGAGVDVKTVQTRLGHASASITLGWYAHAIPENDHEAARKLGALLAAPKEQVEEEEKPFANVSDGISPKVPPKSRRRGRPRKNENSPAAQLASWPA